MLCNDIEAKNFHNALNKTEPPNCDYLEQKYLGYEENEINDSFFLAIQTLQYVHRCKVLPISEMRHLIVKEINKGIFEAELCENDQCEVSTRCSLKSNLDLVACISFWMMCFLVFLIKFQKNFRRYYPRMS